MSERFISSLRKKGAGYWNEGNYEQALACFSETVRLEPSDHQSRMKASACLFRIGEKERALTAYHATAESLLRKGYLLSAIVACKEALNIYPEEKRIRDTLLRIHGRAASGSTGRSPVPPPLPAESLYRESNVGEALVGLTGFELVERAMLVLARYSEEKKIELTERPPLPLFSDLEAEAFVAAVEKMEVLDLEPGEVLIKEGVAGDSVYIFCAGGAQVIRGDFDSPTVLARVGGGTLVGEMSLLSDAPRSASVVTDCHSEVLVVSRRVLEEISVNYPLVPKQLVAFCKRRLLGNLVTTSPLFSPFDEEDRKELLKKFVSRVFSPGSKILEEGSQGDGLYIVLMGEVEVAGMDGKGENQVVARLHEGEIFGEMGLIRNKAACATVTATRKTAVVMLPADDFAEIVSEPKNAEVREYLQELTGERLTELQNTIWDHSEKSVERDMVVV